jgi:lipopolysaccharide export system permease protein
VLERRSAAHLAQRWALRLLRERWYVRLPGRAPAGHARRELTPMPAFNAPLSVLNRYLAGQFLALFVPILGGLVLLYFVVDLVDRLGGFLRNQASVGALARYFVFKIPLMVTQITPPAVIISVLLAFGLLGRRNEIIALRAAGVSLAQTSIPILVAAGAISVAALAWNESVVPYCSRRFQYVSKVEIHKRGIRGVLSERAVWYHGADGFYNIDYVDRTRQAVYGLTIYRLDDSFHLRSVVTVAQAWWRDGHWEPADAVEHQLDGDTPTSTAVPSRSVLIPETLDDFLEVQREPEELTFVELRDRIESLASKGIDASHYLVALYQKLALPFSSLVLALIAVPIAGRLRRHPSVSVIVGLGGAVGFGYWVLLGLSMSLGESGAIPPLLAAWAANGIYVMLGVALFLWSD